MVSQVLRLNIIVNLQQADTGAIISSLTSALPRSEGVRQQYYGGILADKSVEFCRDAPQAADVGWSAIKIVCCSLQTKLRFP